MMTAIVLSCVVLMVMMTICSEAIQVSIRLLDVCTHECTS
jgi:hypothetical protein